MVKHERKRLEAEREKQARAAAKARAAAARRGSATNAFFSVLRARAGIGPGVSAPLDWNRHESDGARGVAPSWARPPKSKKDARKVEKKEAPEASGWLPPLAELVKVVTTPTVKSAPRSWGAADLQVPPWPCSRNPYG